MQPQEIFDTAVKHMWNQGPAVSNEGFCVYRTSDNKSCAVGVFIEDDDLAAKMDSVGDSAFVDIVCNHADLQDQLPEWMLDNIKLLDRLQTMHDVALQSSPENFHEMVRVTANTFGLKVPDYQ